MTLGTNDKKKVGALVVLMLGAVYGVYTSLFSGPSTPSTPAPVSTAGKRQAEVDNVIAPSAPSTGPDIRRAAAQTGKPRSEEFRPVLHPKRKEDQINPMDVDPTLRMDLLAKVQEVKLEGGQRNLFQFGAAQPVEAARLKGPEPQVPVHPKYDYPRPVVEKPPEPVKTAEEPPPPPIPYKYYGISTTKIDGKKTAFFLDGDEIILATEGMVVKKRYKVVRIGATSVLMEDVDSKKQQTLTYTEDAQNASGE